MYQSLLDSKRTQLAIKSCKDFFERELAKELQLIRVSAPLFVTPESGLNDRLSGVERPVEFDLLETGKSVQIVQSLAKWKRYALGKYGFETGEGLYTDMNAIRRDETTDAIHSIYVDQWDWEKVIDKKERTLETLKDTVSKIYTVLLNTERYMSEKYAELGEAFAKSPMPREIAFITSQELEDKYPTYTAKEREHAVAKEYGAVCLMQIGGKLKSGEAHDSRSPDYDDWSMNCDILLYFDVLDISLEISSMGVRVDEEALARQLELAGCTERRELPFHKAILQGDLPYSIGGGIGQSRLCMYFLKKMHIGEVQASVWP
ncbi:MAG: aspartate--ammonia ligase, partial [Ruminococcaceae bacterium]|nr:aspartate--ammonia ligase [Oscillospiraceae bacterium]